MKSNRVKPRLVPEPERISINEGFLLLNHGTGLVLVNDKPLLNQWLRDLQSYMGELLGVICPIINKEGNLKSKITLNQVILSNKQAYELIINETGIEIKGSMEGLFYGLKTLKQWIMLYKNRLPFVVIKDKPAFEHRGWLIDITRGRVPTVAYLKEIIDLSADFKVNEIQLYTEHTFPFDFTTEMNLGKDGLLPEELLELDQYAKERFVTLIPCIATFGHLYECLVTDSYKHLCEFENVSKIPYSWMNRQIHHTLDCRNPQSLALVEKMLQSYIPLFSSHVVNIGGDETFDIGKGRNREISGQIGETRMYMDFLLQVIRIVQKMGKQVMFFGDIIVRHPEFLTQLPKDVILMNWNYDPNVSDNETQCFAKYGTIQYVCPAVFGWNRAINDYHSAYANISRMAEYGKTYKAKGMLTTYWGDFGHVNCFSLSKAPLILGAVLSWQKKSTTGLSDFHRILAPFVGYEGYESLEPFNHLATISNEPLLTFEHLVKWYNHAMFNITPYGTQHDEISQMDSMQCGEHIQLNRMTRLNLIMNQGQCYGKLEKPIKWDLDEMIHMTVLDELFHQLGYVIKCGYFDHCDDEHMKDQIQMANQLFSSEEPVFLGMFELAESIERWLATYIKLWRRRNKESEIGQIISFFAEINHFLRDPKDFFFVANPKL